MASLNPRTMTPPSAAPVSSRPTPARTGHRQEDFEVKDHHLTPVDDPDLNDPALLYMASKDPDGNTQSLTVKFMPIQVDEIRQLVRSQGWPWQSEGAFIRFAVKFMLEKVQAARPLDGSYTGMIAELNLVAQAIEYRQDFEAQIAKWRDQTAWFQLNDADGALFRLSLKEFRQRILDGPVTGKEGLWRDRALQRFDELYGAFLGWED